MFKVISGTLLANRNTIEFTDETISNNSIFEVYADQPDVIPVSVTVGGTTASITFDAKASVNTGIKILVNNIEGEFAPSGDIHADNVIYTNPLMETDNVKDTLDIVVNRIIDFGSDLDDINDELHNDTVLGGVFYHSTTGNTWKKLDASNIDYDSGSTIYSAMGDIDELETESKNLVGAINELNNKPSGGFNISTEETKTGNKYNGKDIYSRAYQFNGSIATNGTNVPSSVIDNLDDMENIFNAYLFRSDAKSFSPLAVYVAVAGSLNVRAMYSAGASPYIYIVLEYTKASDI